MGNMWPFALFVLVELDHKTIDEILGASLPGYAPVFWLATDRYSDAPKKQPGKGNQGTTPPIPEDFKSPWIGQKLDIFVQWLKAKPEAIDLDEHHFAVLDKGARDNLPTIVVCRSGDMDLKGDKLFLLRKGSVEAVEHIVGAQSDYWDQLTEHGNKNAEIEYDEDDG